MKCYKRDKRDTFLFFFILSFFTSTFYLKINFIFNLLTNPILLDLAYNNYETATM